MTKPLTVKLAAPAAYNAAVAAQPAYSVRYANHQSRRHIVVPVVMMVPGVHCGSAGPILHTAEQLARHASAWNGIPVTVGHPMQGNDCVSANRPAYLDTDMIGRVYNCYYDFANNKLRGEVWLDESILLSRQPALVTHLLNGHPMDVSIGAYTDDAPTTGTYQGEQYIAVSSNYRPDHLALLPHEQGACGWNDGCGLRANSLYPYPTQPNNGGNSMEKQLWLAFQLMGLTLTPRVAPPGLQANQQGYLTLIEQIQRKLDSLDSEAQYHYLEEVFDDNTFIYRIRPRDGRPAQYYKRGYTLDATGAVVFNDVMTLVRRHVEYVEVTGGETVITNAASPPVVMTRTRDTNGGNPPMMNNEVTPVVEAPCAPCANSETTPPAEAPIEVVMVPPVEPAEAPVEAPPVDGEAPTPAEAPVENEPQANAAPVDLAAYIAAAPDHLREQLNVGATLYQAHRAQLIKQVTASTTVYAAAELESQPTAALEKLAAAIKAPADYSLRGGASAPNPNAASGDVLLPPGVK